jgi:hypothetical protein
VEASIITVRSFPSSTHEAASIEASSGRQRMTASASLMNFLRVSSSFLNSWGGEMISRSSLDSNLPRTWIPVVPASPSMKTLNLEKSDVMIGEAECWAS